MRNGMTRRGVLIGVAGLGGASLLGAPPVLAQSSGILEKLRKEGVIRVAVPQTPPQSEIRPDGTLVGIAPEIYVPAIMALGIARIEPISATYAELIPGLQAGRWDVCGASLTVSKARCEAVAFTSPFTFGYLSVAYRGDEMTDPPLSLAEAGKRGLKIATNSGGFQLAALRKVAATENLLLFNDSATVVEAVASKRADIAIDNNFGMKRVNTYSNLAFTGALTDMGYQAGGIALRKTDVDLYAALNAEIQKLKDSGHAKTINEKYGNPYDDPASFNALDGATACEKAII